jgi:DNA-binding transcriptional LysR family regulator
MQTSAELRWDDLRVFLALYRRGSLKRAAEDLAVNISTASRRLDALEAAAGVSLFDRTSDGTRPTAAAEQLRPYAESMEQAAHGFVRGLEGFEVEPEGEVRITAPPGVVDHFLAPALADLCRAYPRLRITILSSIGYTDLTRREADVALRIMRPAAGDLVATRLTTQGWCVVASPEHADELAPLRDPNDARWVTWGEELAQLPDRQWIDKHVDAERIGLITSSMTAQIEAVRAGFGVTIVPKPYRELRGLTELRLTPKLRRSIAEIPEASLWLVGHRALRDVPRVAAVWTWVRELFATR